MCRIILLTWLTLFLLPAARSQYPGFTLLANSAPFRQQFSAAVQNINSIKSDFVQEKTLTMLSDKIISSGKFWFKKENRVRMEYFQPFTYLMILDNGHIYIKDGEKENKLSAGPGKLFQQINRIVIDCVKGSSLSNPDFSTRIFESNTSYLIELTPTAKNLKDLFTTINIRVDKKNYSASSIEMLETSGDKTLIRFTNKELNATIPDSIFAAS
jgi:outer membrane lipoprotein-sorting protein